ncbi:zinc-finger-containing protein (plasmid) [Burkholderia aenigmatica]|uniref:zinc-finger-containing protein n=1 Tax=Burkholderia aenigmatica TaxID=2015348 RepID=UPI003B433250
MTRPKRCRYCRQGAELLRFGEKNYPYSHDRGLMWVCAPCVAWVGCHPGTIKPLGGLANAELRVWKIKAHEVFDPLWRAKMRREGWSKKHATRAAYSWLGKEMGLRFHKTHIGYFNVAACKQVVEICTAALRRPDLPS